MYNMASILKANLQRGVHCSCTVVATFFRDKTVSGSIPKSGQKVLCCFSSKKFLITTQNVEVSHCFTPVPQEHVKPSTPVVVNCHGSPY